jgi:hypothetical protein
MRMEKEVKSGGWLVDFCWEKIVLVAVLHVCWVRSMVTC